MDKETPPWRTADLLPAKVMNGIGSSIAAAAIVLAAATAPPAANATPTSSGCNLGAGIKHVIYLQFDNTHLRRDNPQRAVGPRADAAPAQLHRGNGTLMANDHTILISHTAGGILSSLTGVYPDRNGQTVSNSYVRTSSTGSLHVPELVRLLDRPGRRRQRPFRTWSRPTARTRRRRGSRTRAPAATSARRHRQHRAREHRHRRRPATSPRCSAPLAAVQRRRGVERPLPRPANAAASARRRPTSSASRSTARRLARSAPPARTTCCPHEPGGYTGFKGLFGAQAINPFLTGSRRPVLTDLLGHPITDPFGQPGFPGFDGMSAAVSLAYVAAMQEHGIPVTYAYISDAHDFHGVAGNQHSPSARARGLRRSSSRPTTTRSPPSSARLASDGINKYNTLFVFTVDEGDHFVGVRRTTDCDGVNTSRASMGRTRSARSTPTSTRWSRTSSRARGAASSAARRRTRSPCTATTRRRSTSRRRARRRRARPDRSRYARRSSAASPA